MAAYNEEVLIRQKPGGPFPPVRLQRYLDHPDHRNKTELLTRLGRSVVRVTDDSEEDNGGSGFLAKFCLANKDEFYTLVTNEHIIGIDFIRGGRRFYICSELLQKKYNVDLSTCPSVLCSPAEYFPKNVKLIKRTMPSDSVKLFLYTATAPNLDFTVITRTLSSDKQETSSTKSAKFEETEPYLDVTVIELNDKLVDQIGKENFIVIDALQHNTAAVKGLKIFVLEYPSFKNAVTGIPRHLCISEGEVGDYLDDKWPHYVFKHTADTQFKASGSPVLRWDGTVCGVHRGGHEQDDDEGKPDDFNAAAAMNVVLERLQAARSQNS